MIEAIIGAMGSGGGSAASEGFMATLGGKAAKELGSDIGSGDLKDSMFDKAGDAVKDWAKSTGSGGSGAQGSAGASKYGDPNAKSDSGITAPLQHLAAGKIDRRFYGHVLPEHFKKTNIISTSGRVR